MIFVKRLLSRKFKNLASLSPEALRALMLMREIQKPLPDADRCMELLADGILFTQKNNKGWTPLTLAAEKNMLWLVKALVSDGAPVDAPAYAAPNFGSTALMLAAKDGSADIVDYLIENKADVNARADNGRTALMHATLYRRLDIVEKLLAAGADPRIAAHNGETALEHARREGYKEIAIMLEQKIWQLSRQASENGSAPKP